MESSNDICSLFDSYLSKTESSAHEITWIMFSTKLRSSSKKNQNKRSSYVGVMQFANQKTFSSREFGSYREGITWWFVLDCGYIKSHSTSLDDPFNPYQFQKFLDSYLPNDESSTHEITWRMFSTQLRSSSKKNQIKWSSDVGDIKFSRIWAVPRRNHLVQMNLDVSRRVSLTRSEIQEWLILDRGYIKSHSASLDDSFNPYQFQKLFLYFLRNPGGVGGRETLVAEEKPRLRTFKADPYQNSLHLSFSFLFPQKMFGLLKKSKLQQDVYFPFKTVLEKEQMIFGNKKQFASTRFDFVQKQRNQRKRQNRFDDDEKWIRSGDRPFTKAKRSNRDVFDQNELQNYVSLEKKLHMAIHAIRQLKKKENTNTSPAPKQQKCSQLNYGAPQRRISSTEFRCGSYAICKSGNIQFSRIWAVPRRNHLVQMNLDVSRRVSLTRSEIQEWLVLDQGYIQSHSASLDDPFNPYQFQKRCLPSRIISNTQTRISANYHTSSNQNTRITTIKYKKSKREQRRSYSEFAYERLQQGISLGSRAVGEIPSSSNPKTAKPNRVAARNNKNGKTPYILAPRSVYAFPLLPLSRHSIKMEYLHFSDLPNYLQNSVFIRGNLTFIFPCEPSVNRPTVYGLLVKKS
ncbi:hypothetical protein IGI04_007213 [Brassica rapa subsp. trilocularis]|uniref:Uncharacterized protein n=1 Tax=Brassica rapa subsp. trilocularis TaxID=1813537 RepID=A0ABQ7NMA2_BRACM|nr:hypothetical protein IGI04_007213 [Brassica rapa subsp. trilocularis]